MSLATSLHAYVLPDAILRRAPSRSPFSTFSLPALEKAGALSLAYPEKRGILSSATRALSELPPPQSPDDPITIEAHIDAFQLSAMLADELTAIGFEVDGFHLFMPRRFSDHFTLKMKVARREPDRRAQIWEFVQERVALAKTILASDRRCEAYIEVETYSGSCRRTWPESVMHPDWEKSFPFEVGHLKNAISPRTKKEAVDLGLSLDLRKRADIHVKISRFTDNRESREKLILKLVEAGFYHVVTWSPNDVCTAQFTGLSDARHVFFQLEKFFSAYGGCVEQTLEYATELWRTNSSDDDSAPNLSEVPPMVVSIQRSSGGLPA